MRKFHITEFYDATKTYEILADNEEEAWDMFFENPPKPFSENPGECHSQEMEDVTEYA